MKAEIHADGTLMIRAENSTEFYALRVWHDEAYIAAEDVKRREAGHIRASKITILSREEE